MAFMMIETVRKLRKLHQAMMTNEVSTSQISAFVHSLRSYVVINMVFGLVAAC